MSVSVERNLPNLFRHEAPYELTREAQFVANVADELTVPLMAALQQEYYEDRGWMICGPTAIAEGRFLSAITGLPFCLGGEKPHLEISLGLVLSRDWAGKPIEHAALAYVNPPADEIVLIDRIAKILERDESYAVFSPRIIPYSQQFFGLERKYRDGIYEYDRGRCHTFGIDMWGEGRTTKQLDYEEHLAAMHSSAILLQNKITTPSGETYDVSNYWGPRLMRVLQSMHAMLPEELRPPLDAVLA